MIITNKLRDTDNRYIYIINYTWAVTLNSNNNNNNNNTDTAAALCQIAEISSLKRKKDGFG